MAGQPPKESRAFVAGAVLLVLAMLACGVFAGLAGKHVGNKDLDFAIAFGFLGVVVTGIFGLAWLDTTTKSGDHEFMRGHGH
jgi:drug/metabolite transporter (DMT)-like permease